MPELKFAITGDNSDFIASFRQVQSSVTKTSELLQDVGRGFDIHGVMEQMTSLQILIQDYEKEINKSKKAIVDLSDAALEARDAGDFRKFESLESDVGKELQRMEAMTQKMNEYKTALDEIMALRQMFTGEQAPMLFKTQEEFDHVEQLKEKIEELQMKISSFKDGYLVGDDNTKNQIATLRSELSTLTDELNKSQLSAAQAAAELGEGGKRAAELSQQYFQLGKAVDEQVQRVNTLGNELNTISIELDKAKAKGDTNSVIKLQAQYDMFSESLQDAKMHLINLQTEYDKVKQEFNQDSTESIRTQLRKVTYDLMNLTIEYRNLSAEEKASAKGVEMRNHMNELTEKAGELRDAWGDVQRAISGSASDTRLFDTISEGFGDVNAVIGVATGALGLFGAKEEDLQAIQTKLQATLAISNSLQTLQNSLQEESNVMRGISILQTKAENTAIALNTAAKSKNVIVSKAATVVQAAFNAVAKANPYVLLATALITVVGALTAFTLGSKKAADAKKKQQAEAKKLAEEQKELAKALGESTGKMEADFNSLQRSWKRLSTAQEKAKWVEQNKDKFHQLGLSVKSVTDAEKVLVSMAPQVIAALRAQAEANAYEAKLTEATVKKGVFNHRTFKYATAKAGTDTSNLSKTERESITAGVDFTQYYAGMYKLTEEGAKKVNKLREAETLKVKKELEKGYDDNIKLYTDLADNAQKKAEEAKKKLPSSLLYDGKEKKTKTDTSIIRDRQKQLDLELAQREKEEKQRQAANNAIIKARIASIESSGERERAEEDNQHRLRLQAIKNEENDMKKALYEYNKQVWDSKNKNKNLTYADTAEGKAGWSNLVLTEDQRKQIEAEREEEESSYRRLLAARREADMQYLKEYGSIEQQRLAIIEEYEEKIRNASSPIERAALSLEKDNALKDFYAKKLEVNWAGIFSDLQGHTQEYLIGLRDQLQAVLNEGTLTPEQLSVVQDKLRDINDEISKQDGLFNFVGERQREHNRLIQEANDKEQALVDAKEREATAQQSVHDTMAQMQALLGGVGVSKNVADIDRTKLSEYLSLFIPDTKNYEQMKSLIESLVYGEGKLAEARIETAKATNEANKSSDAAKRKSAQALADWFADAQEFIIKHGIDQLPELFESIGLGEVGEKVGQGLAGFNDAAGAAADFASGNYVGALVKGISAIKNFGGIFGIGSGNAKEVAEKTEKLTQSNKQLERSINSLTEEMSKYNGARAIDSYNKAYADQQKINEQTLEILRAQMSYTSAHHSNAYYWDLSRGSYEQINRLLGTSVNSLEGIYSLTPEQLNEIRTKLLDVWNEIITQGKYDKSEYWEQYADLAGALEELDERISENLTQTSFQNVRDAFKSMLMDMDSDAEDFSDDFSKYMIQALLNSKISETLDEELERWYKSWAETMKAQGGRLTKSQIDDYRDEWNAFVQQGLDIRDSIAELTGYESSDREAEGSTGAVKGITSEQAEYIAGRLTSISIKQDTLNASVISVIESLKGLTLSVSSRNGMVEEIRNLMVTQNSYMDDLTKYVRLTYNEFGETLNRIVDNTNRL